MGRGDAMRRAGSSRVRCERARDPWRGHPGGVDAAPAATPVAHRWRHPGLDAAAPGRDERGARERLPAGEFARRRPAQAQRRHRHRATAGEPEHRSPGSFMPMPPGRPIAPRKRGVRGAARAFDGDARVRRHGSTLPDVTEVSQPPRGTLEGGTAATPAPRAWLDDDGGRAIRRRAGWLQPWRRRARGRRKGGGRRRVPAS